MGGETKKKKHGKKAFSADLRGDCRERKKKCWRKKRTGTKAPVQPKQGYESPVWREHGGNPVRNWSTVGTIYGRRGVQSTPKMGGNSLSTSNQYGKEGRAGVGTDNGGPTEWGVTQSY